jgi:hypothetical protein
MPRIKFPQIFFALMLLGFLGAFVVPPASTQQFKPNVQLLFLPVSWPASGVGRWLGGRMGDQTWDDRRNADAIKAENAELRATVLNLGERLSRELAKTAQRDALLPKLRDRGVWVSTAGADAGTRQTLLLRPPIPSGVGEGMYAIIPAGAVGVVQNSGPGGAHVRLVTDVGFRVKCKFARFVKNAQGAKEWARIAGTPVLVEGVGNNTLRVVKTGMSVDDARTAGLVDRATGKMVDDLWAYIEDGDWPEVLQGQLVGQVEQIVPRPELPLFAEITLKPATNLSKLREVMVVTKE